MKMPTKLGIGFISVVSVVALTLFVSSFESAQSARGSSSGKVVGIGSVSTGSGFCDVPPTWKGPIPGKLRFVPTYFDKSGKPHAFCDRQTGIVIQKTPGSPLAGDADSTCENENGAACTWDEARRYCANLTVGKSGQKGWRLMYMPELAALVDINSKSCTEDNVCLPDGHPFKDVLTAAYWSASTDAGNPLLVWLVFSGSGGVGTFSPDGNGHAWCGRGASAADAY